MRYTPKMCVYWTGDFSLEYTTIFNVCTVYVLVNRTITCNRLLLVCLRRYVKYICHILHTYYCYKYDILNIKACFSKYSLAPGQAV